MKTIKTLITISLLNFLFVGSIVLAQNSYSSSSKSTVSNLSNVNNLGNLPTKTPLPSPTPIKRNTQSTQKPLPSDLSTEVLTKAEALAKEGQSTPIPQTNTITPTDTPKADPLANRCIIVIDGVKYDVTDFRKIHSGGDIFQCGSDMSDIFHGQHNDSTLQKMQQYRVG